MSSSPAPNNGLRAIAAVETLKGVIVLMAGFGLLGLLHHDVRGVAVSLVTHLHLDPDEHYVGLFVDAAAKVTDKRLWAWAALAVLYSALRFVEGFGLWFQRRWAAWLGAASGGIYVPVEVYELWHHATPIKAGTLVVNVLVVAYLLWTLRHRPAGDQPLGEAAKGAA